MAEKVTSNGHKAHQKHANIARPAYGEFGRNELAILGTPCGTIKKLAFGLIQQLANRYKLAYVDADHKGADEEAEKGRTTDTALAYGSSLEFTDKITFSRFDFKGNLNSFQFKPFFQNQDLVLVNGNHFPAKNQIVVIDPKKPLEKKLDKLTQVNLILLQEGVKEVPDYVKSHLTDFSAIPILPIYETSKIAYFVEQFIQSAVQPLHGLVLAGGRSTRMGQDKGLLNYHGKDQRTYMYELLGKFCKEVYVSCRPDQETQISSEFNALPDTFLELGPMGAILSAFRANPNVAWLVLACDLPFLSERSLRFLQENRNPSKTATTFQSPENDFPEPLVTIWEPKSYPLLLQFLGMGYSCPRKTLINSDCQILTVPDVQELTNVNNREEYEEAMRRIKEREKGK